MNIKAENLEQFNKEYYSNYDNKPLIKTTVNLETNDILWEELTGKVLKEQMNTIVYTEKILGGEYNKYSGVSLDKIKVKTVYHPQYGNLTRV